MLILWAIYFKLAAAWHKVRTLGIYAEIWFCRLKYRGILAKKYTLKTQRQIELYKEGLYIAEAIQKIKGDNTRCYRQVLIDDMGNGFMLTVENETMDERARRIAFDSAKQVCGENTVRMLIESGFYGGGEIKTSATANKVL